MDRHKFRPFAASSSGSGFKWAGVSLALLFLLPTIALAWIDFSSASRHKFVEWGYTGGGNCNACHSAGGGGSGTRRLFNWSVGDNTDVALCAEKCHGGDPSSGPGPSWPSESEWAGVPANALSQDGIALPPALPHAIPDPGFGTCRDAGTGCHSLGGDFRDCLGCHNDASLAAVFNYSPIDLDSEVGEASVDKFFPSIGSDSLTGHLSGHDILYTSVWADQNDPQQNECLKCHGAVAAVSHPGGNDGTPFLVYPDDTSGNSMGTGITPSDPLNPDYHEYQEFCLSCHDGRADNASANILFSGASVPPMPARDFRDGGGAATPPYLAVSGTTTANYANQNYFENNGHGIATGMSDVANGIAGKALNLTCLRSAGIDNGCHTAHGSTNYYNLDDADFGGGIDTPEELGTNFCIGCHDRADLMLVDPNTKVSTFHGGFSGGTKVLHAGSATSTVAWINSLGSQYMNLGTPAVTANVLPFFASENGDLITDRQYETRVFGGATPSVIVCITCHDPHGTADSYNHVDFNYETGVSNVPMLRVFSTDVDYGSELCRECHVNPLTLP